MSPSSDIWDELREPPPASVVLGGTSIHVGQRVRLKPRAGGDIMDLALDGQIGTIEAIDLTTGAGEPYFSVTIDDDPGRDLGGQRQPGHRFFFRSDEVELIGDSLESTHARTPRVLVAGIGNIFFGDDAFGVSVARRFAERAMPTGVTVRDFGIRGLDLAYALQDDYDVAILVDAMPHGGEPGTLCVIEPDLDTHATDSRIGVEAHGLDPVRVLRLARSIGRMPRRIVVVGCQPSTIAERDGLADGLMALSPPVAAAVDETISVVEALVRDVISHPSQ